MESLPLLLKEIRGCRHCEAHLPLGPRPILEATESAAILIIGQAPGLRVHESGVAWDDPSGDRLRGWMGISKDEFYDASKVAIVPMGFCYPGKGKSGDLPPRKECSELWHERLLKQLTAVRLTMLVGNYAQGYVLGERRKETLTRTVEAWQEYRPKNLPTPHPSPRNQAWFQRNRWFEEQLLPKLRRRVRSLLRR